MKRFGLIILICFLFILSCQARQLVPGSSLAPANATMPVSILNFIPIINSFADGVFITAGASGAENFALAGYQMASHSFVPYAEQSVTINGEAETTSPLYNAEIDLVAFMSNVPTAFFTVPNKNSSQIFARIAPGTLLSLDSLPDANGAPASTVEALVGSSVFSGVTYAAVTPTSSSHFGDPGSGIAAVFARNLALQTFPTTSLDATNVAFTLGTDPVDIVNGIALFWSNPLVMLYAALDEVISGIAPTDYASLIARMLPLQNGTMTVTSVLAPGFDFTTVVPNTNYIVFEQGSSVRGVSSNMQIMQTSTRQPLLVMVGRMLNVGETPDMVQNQVYAVPLTLAFNIESQREQLLPAQSGFLAKKGGGLGDPALQASDLYTPTDTAVQVGQGLLPAGIVINQMTVNGDMVYAVVNNMPTFNGIYASRALFNAQGVVIGWTPWVRTIGSPTSIFGASLNTLSGVWLMLTTTDIIADTVLRTTWQSGSTLEGVAQAIMNLTGTNTQSQSITAMSGLDYRTAGMGNVAALLCTERNQVILAQTGVAIAGTNVLYSQLPDSAYTEVVTAVNTILSNPVGTAPLVLIEGGIFNTMTPLTTSAVAHSDVLSDSWLCVGGNGGVAIWVTSAGAGWGAGFDGDLNALPVGLQMYQLGSYTDVRKLYADGQYLYVATPYKVDRIDLTNGITIINGVAVPSNMPVTVAQVGNNLPGTAPNFIITNVLFSQELGLISTTVGLYRTQSGTSALDVQPMWELAVVPDSEFPIEAITGLGPDGTATTLSQGGYFWVLSGTARSNRSIINRLAVNAISGTVNDTTVLPFACDWFVRNKQGVQLPSFFLDFGQYKDVVVSDGAEYFFARSVEGFEAASVTTPNILSFLTQPRSTNRFVGVQSISVPELSFNAQSDIITLTQEPATGSWYLVTNMGLIVQG